jgi:hypothetical protein
MSLHRINFSANLLDISHREKERLRYNGRLWLLGILPILHVSEELAALTECRANCKTFTAQKAGSGTPCFSPVSHNDPKIGKNLATNPSLENVLSLIIEISPSAPSMAPLRET